VTVNQSRVETRVLTFVERRFFIQVGNLKVGVGTEQELSVLTLFLGELSVTLHGDANLELATSHTLQFSLELIRVTAEHLNDLGVLDTVQKLDSAAVVHETRDGTVEGLRTERCPNTSTKSVLGSSRLETNAVEGKIVDLGLCGVLLGLLVLAVELRGFVGQNLGVLDEAVPLVRVKLLEVLQHSNTRVRVVFTNDLTEGEKNLLAIVGNHDGEGRHVVNGDRLRNGSRQRLGEERDTTLGLTLTGEELGLEGMVFLGNEEGRCSESTLALLLGRNLVVQKLLDVVNGEQVLTVHRNDDGVPDLGDQDLGLVLDFHVGGSKNLGVDTLRQTGEDVSPGSPNRNTEVERASNRVDSVQNNVPEVSIQEEQNQVGDVHQNQSNGSLVVAKHCTNVLNTDAVSDFEGRQNTDGITQRQSQVEVGLCELGTEDHDPKTVGHPHGIALEVRPTGSECLTGDVTTRLAGKVAAEETTEGHDGEEEEGDQGNQELHNTENESDLAFTLDTKDVYGGCDVDDEDENEEEKTLGQVLSTCPLSGDVRPFGERGENHDKGCDSTTETNGREMSGSGGRVIALLLVILSVESRRIVRSVEPVGGNVNDPDTVEVDQVVEPGSGLLVGLEEALLPDDILESLVTLSRRQVDQTRLILENDTLNTLGVPEELVHVIVTNDLVVITLSADVLAVEDFVTLISAVVVQRSDYVVQVGELLNGLNLVLANRRVEVIVCTLEDETHQFRHETDLVGFTPAKKVESNLSNTVVLRHLVHT